MLYDGSTLYHDKQAAMSLADQLLLRPSNADRNINIANEDLENHFKVSMIEVQ